MPMNKFITNPNKIVGRPTRYKSEYADQVFKLCLLGAIDTELADFFGVSEKTINTWKKKHPEFLQSIKDGKTRADTRVAESLFHRALGYSHPEDRIFNNSGEPMVVETTKRYPPDTTAAIFWLKNRQKDQWRDQKHVDVTSRVQDLTDDELDTELDALST
jgi:hypothetical protein